MTNPVSLTPSAESAQWLNDNWESGLTVRGLAIRPAVKGFPVAVFRPNKAGNDALHITVAKPGGKHRLMVVAKGRSVAVAGI